MTKVAKQPDKPERPRAEPEIIPPDRSGGPRGPDWPPSSGYQATQRIYVGRIGPFGFALMMLVLGLFAAVMLLILIGTAMIWIPLAAVFLVIAAVSRIWREL